MCGLCGVISNTLSREEIENFEDLLLLSSFRGQHSTGVMAVREAEKRGSYHPLVIKSAVSSGYFLQHNDEVLEKNFRTKRPIFLAGHCRHATRGIINTQNAHPFNLSNIIGMHNGTLTSTFPQKYVEKKHPKKNKKETVPADETDSESFFRQLNTTNIDEAIKGLSTADAYVFVWYNKTEQKLNFLRNDKRPLWFGATNTGTVYWASEKEMLQFSLNRTAGGNYYKSITDLTELPVDTLVSFNITAFNPALKFETRIVKPPPAKSTYLSNNTEYHSWENNAYDNNFPIRTAGHTPLSAAEQQRRISVWKSHTSDVKEGENLNDELPFKNNIVAFPEIKEEETEQTFKLFDNYTDQKGYQKLLNKGCSWCSGQSELTDYVKWLDNTSHVCLDCSKEPEVKELIGAY